VAFAALGVLDALAHGVLIVAVRADQRPVVYANPALGRLLGLDAADLLQRDALWMLAADTDPSIVAACRAALAGCESFSADITLGSVGERRQCRVQLQPLRGPAAVTHISVTFEDIGAFKRARSAAFE